MLTLLFAITFLTLSNLFSNNLIVLSSHRMPTNTEPFPPFVFSLLYPKTFCTIFIKFSPLGWRNAYILFFGHPTDSYALPKDS